MTLSEQKLETLETEYREFVDALSHDLAGPLRHVIGFSDMILRSNESSFDKKTSEKFNFIMNAGQNGKTMLDQLKNYARLTDKAEPVIANNMSHIVTGILEELKGLIDKNKTKISIGTLPDVIAAPDLLRLSFFHLIKNAIMYSDQASNPLVTIKGVATPTEIKYQIVDNGLGMTDYQIEKVFLVLKRAVTPSDYPGHGMGLAIAKKAMLFHNGTIDIESNVETGTKVSISFPLD